MLSPTLQTLATAVLACVQDGRLVIDAATQGLDGLAALRELFPDGRLVLRDVTVDRQDRSLAIRGTSDVNLTIPGAPGLALADTQLAIAVRARSSGFGVRLAAQTATPWTLLADRLTLHDVQLELELGNDGSGARTLSGGVDCTAVLGGRGYRAHVALDGTSTVRIGIEAPVEATPIGVGDVAVLLGDPGVLAPLEEGLAELGFGGLKLYQLQLSLDLADPTDVTLSLALGVVLRDLELLASLRYPGLGFSASLSPATPVDLKRLTATFGLDAAELPPLALTLCAIEVDAVARRLGTCAGISGEWRIAVGAADVALTEVSLRIAVEPSAVTASFVADVELAGAHCRGTLDLPGFALLAELAPGEQLSLDSLLAGLLSDGLALPVGTPPVTLSQFRLAARPREGTFNLAAAASDLWPLPFGNGLALGKLALTVDVSRVGEAVVASGSLAGTVALGGAELTGKLTLQRGGGSLSFHQNDEPLELTALLAGLLPEPIALPPEIGGLDRLALTGLSGSFDFATQKYAFKGAASLEQLSLGALSVPRATGSLEVEGTGTSLRTLVLTIEASFEQELVPALEVRSVAFVLELRRAEGGAWVWHVGGSIVAGLFDLPRQTLRADASNGEFLFSARSEAPLEWSLPDAPEVLGLSFVGLDLRLTRDPGTGQTGWSFEAKGGLQLAGLPRLSGALGLYHERDRKGFAFTADEEQGELALIVPLVPGEERLTLGGRLKVIQLALLKRTAWELSAEGNVRWVVPRPATDSVDPIDRALAVIGDMFAQPMTATLAASPAGVSLRVAGLPQPPVPIPVLVDGQVVWDRMGSVGLSQLELHLGKTLSGSGKLRVVVPEEINNIFGESQGRPKTRVVNREWLFGVNLDEKAGVSLQVDALPINLEATTYVTTEQDGERRWNRFTLGDVLSFRYGSFEDPPGTSWVHVDLLDLGEIRFRPPSFGFNGADFAARVDVDVVRDLKIPTAPLRWIFAQIGRQDLAERLPAHLEPFALQVLDDDGAGGKRLAVDRLIEGLRTLALALRVGLPDDDALRRTSAPLAERFDRLPADLRTYLDITIPRALELAITVTPAAGLGVKLDLRAPREPLRLLVPQMSGTIFGITLRKLSFGEVLSGSALLLAADLDVDAFDLVALAASLALPPSVADTFTDTRSIQRKFLIGDLLLLIVYQVPIPVPLWFASLGVKHFGLEGLRGQVVLRNNVADMTMGRAARGLFALYRELKAFFTEPERALPADLFSKSGLDLGVCVEPGFIRLPKYLGGGLLGSETVLVDLGVDSLLVPVVSFFKRPDPAALLSLVPLEHRQGSFPPDAALRIGPLAPEATWLISTLQEFERLAAERSTAFVRALYDGGEEQGDSLVAALRRVAVEAAGGESHDGVVVYARGGVSLPAAQGSLRAFAGLLVDRGHGLVSQFRIEGALGSVVAVELGGAVVLVRQTAGGGRPSADLALQGDARLLVLGREALRSQLALKDGAFTFAGRLSLFPPGSAFRVDADVDGSLSAQRFAVAGRAALALAPLPAGEGEVLLTEQRASIALTWLGQRWSLDLSGQPGGQVLLTAAAERPILLFEELIRVEDAVQDGVGPSLALTGPSGPSATLSGRVRVDRLAARGAGLVRVGIGDVDVRLDGTLLGFGSTLAVQATALEQHAASLRFEAQMQQDLFEALDRRMKEGFDELARQARALLDEAQRIFNEEWERFKAALERGAEEIRMRLLQVKQRVEEVLGQLDGLVRQVLGWIKDADAAIDARRRELAGLNQRVREGLTWFQDRVAAVERDLDRKRREISQFDAWYWGLSAERRFWNRLYYEVRRAGLVIEAEALPAILRTVREELDRAKAGLALVEEAADRILQGLQRRRQGLHGELDSYWQQIVDRKRELDHYNGLLAKKSEELLRAFGEAVDSTAKDLAQRSFDNARAVVGKFDEAAGFVASLGALRPFEVQRLTVSGSLGAGDGNRLQARGDIKLNVLSQPRVALDVGLTVDFDDLAQTAVTLARELWERRDKLLAVDGDTYRQHRAELERGASEVLGLRARLGVSFGEPLAKKLMYDLPWDELARFYEYARTNIDRYPALRGALQVMARFHTLLVEYRSAELAYQQALQRFEELCRANPGIGYEFTDPSIVVKRARRRLLDEVERLYKAELTRRIAEGLPVEDVLVEVPDAPVSLFAESNFEGAVQRLVPGRYDLADLTIGNERVKSLWIQKGYRVRLYEHAGFQGALREVNNDATYLGDFDCRTSSVEVICDDLAPPGLAAWARHLPVPGSPVWQPGFRVRYAIAYEYADGSIHRSGWWSPPGGGADADGYLTSDYACAILSQLPCDPTGRAVARRIFRQFHGRLERMIHRIPNNSETQWVDGDLGSEELPLPPPVLSVWALNLPVPGSPVWQPGCRVRYAVALEFADGSEHRSGWWFPTSGGITADADGYLLCDYACACLTGIAVDPTGQAIARRVYRQFRGRPERMIHRLPNNSDTTWVDHDLGSKEEPLAPPILSVWAKNLPVPDSPVWQPGCEVRYAIAHEFADGSEHRSGWWSPTSGGIPADTDGYLRCGYACACLTGIAVDPTGQAVARRIYRQFRGRPERMIHRILNDVETEWVDDDLGLAEGPLSTATGAAITAVYAGVSSHAEAIHTTPAGTLRHVHVVDGAWRLDAASLAVDAPIAGPIAAVYEAQRAHTSVFYRGSGGRLHFAYVADGLWRCDSDSLGSIGGALAAAYSPERQHAEAFFADPDGDLVHAWVDGGWRRQSSAFMPVGKVGGAIAAVHSPARRHTEVFWVRADGRLVHSYVESGAWQHHHESFAAAGSIVEVSAVYSPAREHTEVFALSADGRLHYFYVAGGAWRHDPQSLGTARGGLSATYSPIRSHAELFYVSQDGHLAYAFVNVEWRCDAETFRSAGRVRGGVAAVYAPQREHSEVFFADDDGMLRYFFVEGGVWRSSTL